MKIRTVSRKEIEAWPHCIWNAYVDLLAMEQYNDLTSVQRVAHLVFQYESEVQNGGHLQFFENRGAEHLEETIDSLGLLGAACQQLVLREASESWLMLARPRIDTAEEFCKAALDGEFEAFDLRFAQCAPNLCQKLEEYLRQYQSSFVVIS